jgi:predicted enzyme related to lactoylglutathione lyase
VPVAGVLQNPIPDLRTSWVSYIGVRDVDDILTRVEGLGGRIIVDTIEMAGTSDAAAIVDPSGAGLMLQTWPLK